MSESDIQARHVALACGSYLNLAVPCCRCGTRGGAVDHRSREKNLRRVYGGKFGIEGQICGACYTALQRAAKQGPISRIVRDAMEWPKDQGEACALIRELWGTPNRHEIITCETSSEMED